MNEETLLPVGRFRPTLAIVARESRHLSYS